MFPIFNPKIFGWVYNNLRIKKILVKKILNPNCSLSKRVFDKNKLGFQIFFGSNKFGFKIKKGLHRTRKLQQCTNWKENIQYANLPRLQIKRTGPSSWSVQLVWIADSYSHCILQFASYMLHLTSCILYVESYMLHIASNTLYLTHCILHVAS